MKFSLATLTLLTLFSSVSVSASANAIPNPEAASPASANTARDAAPEAEPNTGNLWNAINQAAQAKQSAALHPNLGIFGGIGQPKPKPKIPKVAGLGLVGVGQGQRNYRAECKKKNPKIERVIAKFCERGSGGKGGVTVPNKDPSGGMCTGRDPAWSQETGKGFGFSPSHNQWCAKIGSKKKNCKPFIISKDTCMGKLFQVCAKGDNSGKGKAAENGNCQIYRMGKINYSNNVGAVAKNPFKSGWTGAGFY